jgi:hypothetical protein
MITPTLKLLMLAQRVNSFVLLSVAKRIGRLSEPAVTSG